jgi:hypothetical protein
MIAERVDDIPMWGRKHFNFFFCGDKKFKNIYTSFKENIKVFHWPSDDEEEWVVHPAV